MHVKRKVVKKGRAYHHGDLGAALVEAALRLVVRDGPGAVTLRAVAKLAGVTAMASYRHFPDKGALLLAVARRGLGELRAELAAADNGAARAALVKQGIAYVRFAIDNPHLFKLMFSVEPQWEGAGIDRLATRPETGYSVLYNRIGELFPSTDRQIATLASWSFIHGLASLLADRRLSPYPTDVEAFAEKVTAFFVQRL